MFVSSNQNQYFCINQSEWSITWQCWVSAVLRWQCSSHWRHCTHALTLTCWSVLHSPSQHSLSTNQRRVLSCFNQSEESTCQASGNSAVVILVLLQSLYQLLHQVAHLLLHARPRVQLLFASEVLATTNTLGQLSLLHNLTILASTQHEQPVSCLGVKLCTDIRQWELRQLTHGLHSKKINNTVSELSPQTSHFGHLEMLIQVTEFAAGQHCLLVRFVETTAQLGQCLAVRHSCTAPELSPLPHLRSEISISICQPIRHQYDIVSTNQRWVLYCVNQSDISIVLCQPIRDWDYYDIVSVNLLYEHERITHLSSDIFHYLGAESKSEIITSSLQSFTAPVSDDIVSIFSLRSYPCFGQVFRKQLFTTGYSSLTSCISRWEIWKSVSLTSTSLVRSR